MDSIDELNRNILDEALLDYLISFIAYKSCAVCRDHTQWTECGLPFVDKCIHILNLVDYKNEIVDEKFRGFIGRGFDFLSLDADNEWTSIVLKSNFLLEIVPPLLHCDKILIFGILKTIVTDLIMSKNYTSFERSVIHSTSNQLLINLNDISQVETDVIQSLRASHSEFTKELIKYKENKSLQVSRLWKIGFAALTGGSLMFLTGKIKLRLRHVFLILPKIICNFLSLD